MRQLLIVKSPAAFSTAASPIDNGLTSHSVKDLSGLKDGAITFFELGADISTYNAAPSKNFAIALGRSNGQLPFMISEVDVNTLRVTKTLPVKGNPFSIVVTVPTTEIGKEYTLRFFKKGTVPHERNSWTASIVAKSTTAADEAAALKKVIEDKISDKFNLTVSISGAAITITGRNYEDWEVKAADSMPTSALGSPTEAKKAIGDKAYVEHLASFCAAGKGFRDTDYAGREFLPGYPETVEDLTPNDSGDASASTSGYVIYTLRFAVSRDASKQRDERVWQNVYVAVPIDGESTYGQIAAMDSILPEGDFENNSISALTMRVETIEQGSQGSAGTGQ